MPTCNRLRYCCWPQMRHATSLTMLAGSWWHTHTRLTASFSGLPGWAGTRRVKPIWILLKQETVSGSGISWTICKSAPRFRQTTMPAPHHSVFTGRMPLLPPNQQRQSIEGSWWHHNENPLLQPTISKAKISWHRYATKLRQCHTMY